MAEPHPYLELPFPKNAPVELRPTPGKVWGAFATRDIKRGSVIMKEKAMFVIQKPNQNITDRDVEKVFDKLNPSQQHLYFCLSGKKPRTRPNGITLIEWVDISEIWRHNSFSLDSKIEPKLFGKFIAAERWGFFPCHSRFNHSCQENATCPECKSSNDISTSFADRDIAAGEEITIRYKNGLSCHTRDERNKLLGFTCRCQFCDSLSKDKTLGEVSDMRRRLIRGLIYLLDGIDMNSEYHDDNSPLKPVICDPIMRKAADNCDFPLSARLIQDLMLAFLSEAEGATDVEGAAQTWTHVWRRACLFGTKENRAIATRDVKQKTWRERLEMAFLLDGRADAADRLHTIAYRRVKGITVS